MPEGKIATVNEGHRTGRIGWLRAAVLGANDGIVSTASLMVGVAAAQADRSRHPGRRRRGTGRRRAVDGGRRVRLGQLAGRHRAGRAAIERHELATHARSRRGRAHRDLRRARPRARPRRAGRARSSWPTTRSALMPAMSWASTHWRARPLQAALASAATFAVGAALPLLRAGVARAPAGADRLRRFARLARWRSARRGTARRRRRRARRGPRHLLGRGGDGRDGRRRPALRRCGLTEALLYPAKHLAGRPSAGPSTETSVPRTTVSGRQRE